jgi:exosortase/archaeosortase family protein
MVSKRLEFQREPVLENRELFKLCLLFLLLVSGLTLLVWMPNPVGQLTKYLVGFTTLLSGKLTNLLGIGAEIVGNTIVLRNQTFLINVECTGLFLMILYVSFVLVYPSSLRQKIVGIFLGLPTIFIANMTRILIGALLVEFKPQFFPYFHEYTWQIAFIVLVISLCVLWVDRVVDCERKTAISA